jgi:nucleoside-diphosphate-sugar epimerase
MSRPKAKRVLVTGGCGYVGSILVPRLAAKQSVIVLDISAFGNAIDGMPNVTVVRGDIRDKGLVQDIMKEATDVVHLAAIANDPSSDLDPQLTYQVNRDAVELLVKEAKKAGVRRFISASSSSVYGVKDEVSVTEELSLLPMTLYARLKAESEAIISREATTDFTVVSVRSATVCGVSPRMRFDVIVNMFAKMAAMGETITVWGGDQQRPNIHISDLGRFYEILLDVPSDRVNGRVYNVGAANHTVKEIAQMVQEEIGGNIVVDPKVLDNRSYRISSERAYKELGFATEKTIRDAVQDIRNAFQAGAFPNPNDDKYYNVRVMSKMDLTTPAIN